MSVIELSRQQRVDGGLRTSLFVDGERIFHQLENANPDEPDPTLEWFVDIRFVTVDVPTDDETLREWLLGQSATAVRLLEREAEKLELGLDEGGWPRQVSERIGPIEVTLIYSAMRRVAGRQIAGQLRHWATNWETILEDLPVIVPTGT